MTFMKNILVSDVMTRDSVTVEPTTNLLECARKMVRKRMGSLLIVNKKRFEGFITERDILWVLIKKSKEDLSEIKAIDISPRKIVTIKPSSTIEEAIKKMRKSKGRGNRRHRINFRNCCGQRKNSHLIRNLIS